MAKKQTRRSISLNRDLFDQAQAHAEAAGIPLAKFAENALRAAMAPAAAPTASPTLSIAPAPAAKMTPPAPRADDFGDANGHPVADPVVEYDATT